MITWSDANRDDPSLANEIYFDIYRDGKRIATTRSTRYEDYDYVSGAVYHVAARRVYDDPQDGLDFAHVVVSVVSEQATATIVFAQVTLLTECRRA